MATLIEQLKELAGGAKMAERAAISTRTALEDVMRAEYSADLPLNHLLAWKAARETETEAILASLETQRSLTWTRRKEATDGQGAPVTEQG